MSGWSLQTPFDTSLYTHDLEHHHSTKCRVMLGGEIYYRAIGRPWGSAADFIVTVPAPAHCSRHWQAAARAVREPERSEPLAHSSLSQAGILRSTIRGPPARAAGLSVRPSDRTVCPPVRPVRSCCLSWKPVFRSGPVKKKFQAHTETHRCWHRAGKKI
jgi:hypothetical protein